MKKKAVENRSRVSTTSPRRSSPSEPVELGKASAALARAADALQISHVRFVSFSATTSHRFGEKLPRDVQVRMGFTKPDFVQANNRVVVTTTFVFRLSTSDQTPVVQFRAETEIAYVASGDAQLELEDVGLFARLNAPFNAWAYWREALQSAMNRMDLPAFPIPLLRRSEIEAMTLGDDEP